MNNVVWINNCNIIGGTIYKSTLIVPQSMVPMFAGMKANIITLTGDQNVDKALADPEEEQKKVDTDV
jgi:hypothetical protein